MKLTFFDSLLDNQGEERELSFVEFIEEFKPRPTLGKDNVPLFSPALYDGKRSKNNVTHITALVFDLDDLRPGDYWVLCAMLEAHECDYLLYSTFSHHPNAPKLRLFVPMERPLPIENAADWSKNYWFSARDAFELEPYLDGSTKDPSRIYYIPCYHPDREDPGDEELADDVEYIIYEYRSNGVLFQPESLPRTTLSGDRTTLQDVEATDLSSAVAEYANELKRNKSAKIKEIGKRILIMLQGGVYAQPGNRDLLLKGRDNATFLMAAFLAEGFPRRAPEELAQLFVPSLKVMEEIAPGAPTYESVMGKIERKQQELKEAAELAKQREDAARANLIQRAFCSERTHAYTPEEMERFGDMSHKWIILHGKSYYVFFDGNYNEPVSTQDEMQLVAERDLSPADAVNLWTVAPNGMPIQKSPKEIVRQYGDTATDVVYDLTIKTSKFEDKVLHLAKPGWDISLKPSFNGQVQGWLEELGGNALLAWLSKFPDLTVPLAALYMANRRGAGKSLLAKGLVRLWGKDAIPVPAEQAFGQFRSSMLLCPLIFADESMPRIQTTELREMIQAGDRIIDIKYRTPIKQRGHIRMMMAANNEHLITTSENLSAEDVHAINDRFLFLDVDDRPSEYLQDLVDRGVDLDKWRTEGTIAKHVLWLAENLDPPKHSRYLYGEVGPDNQLGSRLAIGSAKIASILDWALRGIRNPEVLAGGDSDLKWDERGLHVTPDLIHSTWGLLMRHERHPSPLQIAMSLESVSKPNPDAPGSIIQAPILHLYNERIQLFQPEQLDMLLKRGNV